jgi:hypothetical protein
MPCLGARRGEFGQRASTSVLLFHYGPRAARTLSEHSRLFTFSLTGLGSTFRHGQKANAEYSLTLKFASDCEAASLPYGIVAIASLEKPLSTEFVLPRNSCFLLVLSKPLELRLVGIPGWRLST